MASDRGPGPSLSDADLSLLIDEVKDHQLTHGALLKLVRFEEATTVTARPIGVSLLPSPFPRRCFEHAWTLQPAFHELYVHAADDVEWLASVLEPLCEHDEFLATLWGIQREVARAGRTQDVCCGVFRSDYMLHQEDGGPVRLKQVEMNTIAVAGACHAEQVASMHRHLSRVRDVKNYYVGCHIVGIWATNRAQPKRKAALNLTENHNISGLVNTLKTAHVLYKQTISGQTCVLMIVQPDNFNIADERPIEYALWNSDVPCFRCEWQSILDNTLSANDGTLLFCPPSSKEAFEVSVIYFRAGFEPHEYDSYGTETRLRLELSRSIKCPDILTHLTTFKAVQQALTLTDNLNRLAPDKSRTEISDAFMPCHKLNNDDARAIATSPELAKDYVLKPNREGGGHNVHRSEIPGFLASIPKDDWSNHVLMRVIRPPDDMCGALMTPEGLYNGPAVSELGVLGGCIWRCSKDRQPNIMYNEAIGWTFKSKPKGIDEMSVVKGFGCFDSPLLTI